MLNRFTFILFACLLQVVPRAQVISTDSLLSITQTGNARDQMLAYQQLGQLFKNSEPDRGLGYLDHALKLAEQLNDDNSLGKCYQLSAGILARQRKFDKAIENYNKAEQYYQKVQNARGSAECEYAMANIYNSQGKLLPAIEHFMPALTYFENVNDQTSLGKVYNSLSEIYLRQNNFSKSIEYNLKAVTIYENTSDKKQAVEGYGNLGNTYLNKNDLTKAAEYFNKSLVGYSRQKNPMAITSTLQKLGDIAEKQGNLNQAEQYYRRALALSNQLGARPLQVINLNSLGGVYYAKQHWSDAILLYKKSAALAKATHMNIELEEAYHRLSELYKKTSEQKKVTTFHSLSNEIKDSLFNDSIMKLLENVSLRIETDKKQTLINLLSKDKAIRDVELAKQQTVTKLVTISVIIIGMVLLILIYFFIQNKRFSDSLQKQQNELMAKTEEITRQKESLDQLNTVKDRFFSIISHDLRNNLTTMKLYFDLISNPGFTPDDYSEVTRQISGSVENTIDLLENLLVWASAQIKGVPVHIQKLHIYDLVEENMVLVGGNASQKKINLVNSAGKDITVYADMDMINLVIRNLLSNAIKFTPESGSIEVGAGHENGICTVFVKDNGVGINKEQAGKMFDQHLHPTTKGTANEKGTGLGLMLCKDFIERNNGKIWVESGKEKGSVFYFTLPEHDAT